MTYHRCCISSTLYNHLSKNLGNLDSMLATVLWLQKSIRCTRDVGPSPIRKSVSSFFAMPWWREIQDIVHYSVDHAHTVRPCLSSAAKGHHCRAGVRYTGRRLAWREEVRIEISVRPAMSLLLPRSLLFSRGVPTGIFSTRPAADAAFDSMDRWSRMRRVVH